MIQFRHKKIDVCDEILNITKQENMEVPASNDSFRESNQIDCLECSPSQWQWKMKTKVYRDPLPNM